MKKVSLLFGIHMHQPVDNTAKAVDEAVALCYEPFFETMSKYPEFKFALHCSGWLLDIIRTKHTKIFNNMKKLTQLGAIEWISAGYYEPVLSAIPSKDRQAQVSKLNNYIKEHLGVMPKGLWLSERVWEPAIIPDLQAVGTQYTMVDDYHFLSSGFESSKMDGYYETEESGHYLSLFPISKKLRYALPFSSVNHAIDAILEYAKEENSAAIIFDDGEKFGLWSKTHEQVYKNRWLEHFVEAVLSHKEIETKHYGEYLEQNHSKGLAYINNTSYFEMGEWSLKTNQTLALEALKEKLGDDYFDREGVAFIKGGIWKNFFIKYHESNYLHKRMLYWSLKQDTLDSSSLESLYKLQTNDVLWHGIFGGLYLDILRDNAYSYLLEIEQSQAKEKITYEYCDIDKDGYQELKVLSKSLSSVFSCVGAQMLEFGSLDKLFNWQNTIMRRKEAYHEEILHPKKRPTQVEASDEVQSIHNIVKDVDETLRDELIYDWHPKNSFVDHFSQTPFDLNSFKTLSFCEIGDFANSAYELDAQTNTFLRNGKFYLQDSYESRVEKRYVFEDDGLSLDFRCKSDYAGELFYAMEFNFHFKNPYLVLLNGKNLEDGLSISNIETLSIVDSFTQKEITLRCTKAMNIDAYILNTVSQSENGFDRVAQQISLIFSVAFASELNIQMHLGVSNV
nr:alpha-amylase/4-alpha-glucanotransferase domain-containing protein [uncultured Sulfurimonas sp.]